MNPKILLIGAKEDRRWEKALRVATLKLGYSYHIISNTELDSINSWREYALIVLDISNLGALSNVISNISLRSNNLPIVVVSPAPGWQEAKEALKAGAVDYQLKSSRDRDVLEVLRNNLKKNH